MSDIVKRHSPELAEKLKVLVAELESRPEELRGPFKVKGLRPYAEARATSLEQRLHDAGVET